MYTETAYPVIDLARTGRNIERRRRDAGLTVRDLQTYFGFEYPQAIYKWQHGECLPTVDNLLALARLLRVPMEDLLVYDDQEVAHFLGESASAIAAVFSIPPAGRIKPPAHSFCPIDAPNAPRRVLYRTPFRKTLPQAAIWDPFP